MASEMSPLAASLKSHVALLGCGAFTSSLILHPLVVPVHTACGFVVAAPLFAMVYRAQYACFDPGGVDPASLAAPGIEDDCILDFLDVAASSVGSDGSSALYGLACILHSLDLSHSASHLTPMLSELILPICSPVLMLMCILFPAAFLSTVSTPSPLWHVFLFTVSCRQCLGRVWILSGCV